MGMIRQYLKQKVARSFTGKHVDMDVIKKELKDEITHILYDQTRRTPIVIPVINEIGGQSNSGQNNNQPPRRPNGQNFQRQNNNATAAPKTFRLPQVPDSEAAEPRNKFDYRGY
jgi:ribonuclease J